MSLSTKPPSFSQFTWAGPPTESCPIESYVLAASSYQSSGAGSRVYELGQAILDTRLLTLMDRLLNYPTSKDLQATEKLLQAAKLDENITLAEFLKVFRDNPSAELAAIYKHPACRSFNLVYQEEPGD
jgi:hypothetical protein